MTISTQNSLCVTISEILIFLILNPLAPAINCALWMGFRILDNEEMSDHYRFLSKLTCLINGTFESPVQIILTLFFFITGRIQSPWQDTTEITDSLGNRISFGSYISLISFSLCWVSLIKNVTDSYQCGGLGDFLSVIAFVLPNVLFRIFSYTTLFVLVREWTFAAILLILVLNFFIGSHLKPHERGINLYSSTFCSIFCVVGMPNHPRGATDRSIEVDHGTLKKITLSITIVSIPIIVGSCALAYILPAKLGMMQDVVNFPFTAEQEFFLMIVPYAGLVVLSLISCIFFGIIFNNKRVPGCIKTCLNILTIGATISGLVVTILYFPPSPTSVVLTVEKDNGGKEIFEGFIFSPGKVVDSRCHVERANGSNIMLTCSNMTILADFANGRRNIHSMKMIVLDPESDKNIIYEDLDGKTISLYLVESESLHSDLEAAVCLECHHPSSNVCKNIISASNRIQCTSTCSHVPQTFKPLTKRTVETFLSMESMNRTMDQTLFWIEKLQRKRQTRDIEVVCKTPSHFFEREGTADCSGSSVDDCRVMQAMCMGNDKWELKSSSQCRRCKNDEECIGIGKGNECTEGVCVKKLMVVGLSQEESTEFHELSLFDPKTLKTDTCKIPSIERNTKIIFNNNVPHAIRSDGTPFRLEQGKWNQIDRLKKVARKEYAATILRDGGWLMSGGRPYKRTEELDSTKILRKFGRENQV